MLPSSKRLTTTLFKKVLEKGKIFSSNLFVIKLQKTEGISRFSVAVSKKVEKTAVGRNKMRRTAYSYLRHLYPSIKKGYLGVVTVKFPLKGLSSEKIAASLEELFVKSGLLE